MFRELLLLLFGGVGFFLAGLVIGFVVGKKFSVANVASSAALAVLHPSLVWLNDIWTGITSGEIAVQAGIDMAKSVVEEANKKAASEAPEVDTDVKVKGTK